MLSSLIIHQLAFMYVMISMFNIRSETKDDWVDKYCHDFWASHVFFTSCPNKCSAKVLPPLNFSLDHLLINVKIYAKPKPSSSVPFHRTIFHIQKLTEKCWKMQRVAIINESEIISLQWTLPMLENKSQPLPDFPPLRGHNLYLGSGSFQVKPKTWLFKDYWFR